MRIAHIVSTYPPYRSGMGNVAQRQAAELARKGHAVTVLTPAYDGRVMNESQQGVTVKRLRPKFTYGNSAFVPRLYRELAGFDIIHLHYPFFGGAETVAWYVARHPRSKLVITYHMDVVGQGWMRSFFAAYHRLFLRWMLRQARVVLVSSADYAAHSPLLKRFPALKPVELPFGVDERFTPKPMPVAAGVSAANAKHEASLPRFVFVSALDKAHYFKGLDVLLAAFAESWKNPAVASKRPRLIIVGDGDMRSGYEAEAKRLGVAGQVDFLGSIDDTALIEQYRLATATIKPSVDRSEAFGLTSLEAMACGSPIIVSDLPGVRTLVDAKSGLTVPVGDHQALAQALLYAIQEPQRFAAMRQGAAARVNALYRWPAIISRLERIYEDLVRL